MNKKIKLLVCILFAIVFGVTAICICHMMKNLRDDKEKSNIVDIENAHLNQVVSLGCYEDEPIEWLVIDETEDKLMLLSKYALCVRIYDNTYSPTGYTDWEQSDVRKWLNDSFYHNSFNDAERKLVEMSDVKNKEQLIHWSDGGNDTKDYIYLLSDEEVCVYLKKGIDRKCTYVDGTPANWWLRSRAVGGYWPSEILYIDENGEMPYLGCNRSNPMVDYEYEIQVAVRPAMWIDRGEILDDK